MPKKKVSNDALNKVVSSNKKTAKKTTTKKSTQAKKAVKKIEKKASVVKEVVAENKKEETKPETLEVKKTKKEIKKEKKAIKKENKAKEKEESKKIEKENLEKEKNTLRIFVDNIGSNPKVAFKTLGVYIKDFFYTNKFFLLFVALNVLNGFLLRLLTANTDGNAFNLDTLLADISFMLLLGSISFLMKKKKYRFYIITTWVLSIICVINSVYYTYYTSYTSVTLLSIVKYTTSIGDAIFENVMQLKDFIYLLVPITMMFIKKRYLKSGYFTKTRFYARYKRKALGFFVLGLICLFSFFSTCTATDFGRLDKQWNREYIVMKYGIYIYHVNDLIKSVEPKVVSIFGYDSALKNFKEYFSKENPYDGKNEYTDIFQGKNIVMIHAESIQNFVIGLKFNGQEVTPNLNKLAKNGLYFENFYTQVSVGTSSDTEFTFNTSLMPANYGTAFSNYFDKKYVAIPQMLKDKGYYTYAMHGNVGDFWNRRLMHANLGYDELFDKKTYEIDDVIGLGISDKSFFRQSVEKVKKVASEHDKWFTYVITLSNHTPFSDLDKYGPFDVNIKEGDTTYSYMEGTKLGRYLKSVHYADEALGEFINGLDKEGLLDNTVFMLFGDHDARLPQEDFDRLYNYDKTTDDILPKTDPRYREVNDYTYELDRKTPFIIWSKSDPKIKGKVSYYMGMYDVLPTIGNMFGFKSKYALGHDIFNIKDNNIIVFPTSNWLTKDMYYNAQKEEGYAISGGIISDDYIAKNNKYAEDLLKVSNDILIYDLIRNANLDKTDINEQNILDGADK